MHSVRQKSKATPSGRRENWNWTIHTPFQGKTWCLSAGGAVHRPASAIGLRVQKEDHVSQMQLPYLPLPHSTLSPALAQMLISTKFSACQIPFQHLCVGNTTWDISGLPRFGGGGCKRKKVSWYFLKTVKKTLFEEGYSNGIS